MNEICPKCGLPKELCVCETIAKESQKIIVKIEKKKFGKKYTIIEGLSSKDLNPKQILKTLKSKLACGGTIKEGLIELQGDHLLNIKKELSSLGFSPDVITIKK